ncbi:MAG: A/G-specific adenine glycosylase [Treponema sp.]|jgi:A/G-specific adenine glycosylase|nr:A/G-specific adenine glycosylase [Treponema sp.]
MPLSPKCQAFKEAVLSNYRSSGRVFPWRKKRTSPWGVLVSEFMLQQTQTARVVSYWEAWMKKWPAVKDVARAGLGEVLSAWSGLGYNSRARRLWECAKMICADYGGRVPKTPGELVKLPGIGPYTSGAIACFAWDYPAVFIETNIRAAALHFFFEDRSGVGDDEIIPFLKECVPEKGAREWYYALMDYGAALKKTTLNPGRKSAHYAKQSRFEGSFRQIRGAIVRVLAQNGPQKKAALQSALAEEVPALSDADFCRALDSLQKEMMVAETDEVWEIGGE